MTGGEIAFMVVLLSFAALGYLTPMLIAINRYRMGAVYLNPDRIAFINLLTGWTVAGWVVALVMACRSGEYPSGNQVYVVETQSTVPVAMTDEAYEAEKARREAWQRKTKGDES
jgi:hypothetical protein